tara:strand:+ start:1813 stop:2373 length:561 start_codon:yes stop_codon:yes gene_type:complete
MFGGVELVHLTVSGHPGSGTTTLVNEICRRKGWDSLNGGEVFRTSADERGVTLEEFSSLCDKESEVDKSLDQRLISAMLDENGPEVVESRLSGWWAYQHEILCIRLWLSVSIKERANRVVNREGGSHDDVVSRILERMESDQKRYKNLYEISLDDMTPYNMIIETDSLSATEVADMVENALNKKEA